MLIFRLPFSKCSALPCKLLVKNLPAKFIRNFRRKKPDGGKRVFDISKFFVRIWRAMLLFLNTKINYEPVLSMVTLAYGISLFVVQFLSSNLNTFFRNHIFIGYSGEMFSQNWRRKTTFTNPYSAKNPPI